MGKMRMGSDQRDKKVKLTRPMVKSPLGSDVDEDIKQEILHNPVTMTSEMINAALEEYFKANPIEEKELPLATMIPSCACSCSAESKVIERTEVIVKEISTKDQRARNHSVATRNELHTMMNRKHDLLNRALSIQSKKSEEQHARLHALEQRKPEEKQIVIEKTEVRTKSHSLVIGGLVVSLLLNVLILIVK